MIYSSKREPMTNITTTQKCLTVLALVSLAVLCLLISIDQSPLSSLYQFKSVRQQSSSTLGQLEAFRYLINQDVCGQEDVYMVVLVGSHPNHTLLRQVIRTTWGNPMIPGFPFKLAFTFGHIQNPDQQLALEEESRTYGDIIQGNFQDSYRNVTLRDLMGLRWVWQHCRQAKFFMHADDDVSIDVYGLIDALEDNFVNGSDFIGCFIVWMNSPVLREGRYALTKEEHPSDTFEPYCSGWMYVLTPRMAYDLDMAALSVRPYWMNDVYLTGTLVKALGRLPQDLKVNGTISLEEMAMAINQDVKLQPKYTVGPTGGDEHLTFILHQNYKYYALLNGIPRHRRVKMTTPRLFRDPRNDRFNEIF